MQWGIRASLLVGQERVVAMMDVESHQCLQGLEVVVMVLHPWSLLQFPLELQGEREAPQDRRALP